jgi:alkanesulfonate monooxygenase SsuD/methylene tetrahydromethanopterin reductase-like flavin-dependent oxidoreductase (luciferase family)
VIGPHPGREGSPELILGGTTEASFRRVAEFADGWITGGGSPDTFAEAAAGVDAAWQKAGRAGTPRKLSPARFGLGPEARTQADACLLDYYGFLLAEAITGVRAGRSAVRRRRRRPRCAAACVRRS